MKKKTVMTSDEIIWALEAEGVNMDRDSWTGVFQGRQIRVNCNQTVDIGDDNFDRWANSVAVNFNPKKGRFSRQFRRACMEAGCL